MFPRTRETLATGRLACLACGAWGYLAEARQRWQEEQQRQAALRRPPARPQRMLSQRPPAPRPPGPHPPAPRAPVPARPELAQQLAVFQAALPGSRGAAYLQQRGIPLALAPQLGVGSAALGTWPHAARDCRGGRVVFLHTTPDGRLVNLYGRAVGTAEQVPKAKRHDHLPGEKGYFNAAALQAGAGPLWVCEGAFDALALLAVQRLTALDAEATPLWVSRQVLREYLAAMTRPGELTGTIPLPALLNDVRYFAQRFRVADEGAPVTAQLLALLTEIPVAGRHVHDANIVATMLVYGVRRVLTHNTDDFVQFAAFIEVLPLVPPPASAPPPSA